MCIFCQLIWLKRKDSLLLLVADNSTAYQRVYDGTDRKLKTLR